MLFGFLRTYRCDSGNQPFLVEKISESVTKLKLRGGGGEFKAPNAIEMATMGGGGNTLARLGIRPTHRRSIMSCGRFASFVCRVGFWLGVSYVVQNDALGQRTIATRDPLDPRSRLQEGWIDVEDAVAVHRTRYSLYHDIG